MTSTVDFGQAVVKQTKPRMTAACGALGWSAEVHTLHGDRQTIEKKLAVGQMGLGRRLFYLTVETGEGATIFEFENTEGEIYEVRKAETCLHVAQQFNQASSDAIYQNKGRTCVGDIVQHLDNYSMLEFTPFQRGEFDPEKTFFGLLPETPQDTNKEKVSCCHDDIEKPDEATFMRATLALLC
jgi:hypothetical protein